MMSTALSSHAHWVATARGRLYAQSWTPPQPQGVPLILLHDSLGCVALWRDFPERLAQATGRQVIAYDRLGFGRSDAHPGILPVTFVQDEPLVDLAAVVRHFGLTQFVVFGHSVGGGMAVYAAAAFPDACVGVVTESAQAFVESVTIDGIRAARDQFAQAGQMERLQKYHGSKAEWVLQAWIDTWLSEAFRPWSMDAQLPMVTCPVLCLHGDHDEYGSLQHPQRIARGVGGAVTLSILRGCGHVPHRERADVVLSELGTFLTPA